MTSNFFLFSASLWDFFEFFKLSYVLSDKVGIFKLDCPNLIGNLDFNTYVNSNKMLNK